MPQTLTGTNTTDPTSAPTATVPVDTETGNVASVNGAFQGLLNAIGWLRSKVALLNMAGGVITNHGTPVNDSDVATKGFVVGKTTTAPVAVAMYHSDGTKAFGVGAVTWPASGSFLGGSVWLDVPEVTYATGVVDGSPMPSPGAPYNDDSLSVVAVGLDNTASNRVRVRTASLNATTSTITAKNCGFVVRVWRL